MNHQSIDSKGDFYKLTRRTETLCDRLSVTLNQLVLGSSPSRGTNFAFPNWPESFTKL
jgi:hypothetical protein